MKNLFYILIALSVFLSCKKDEPQEETESITLSGRILKDCSLEPYRNTYMRLVVHMPPGNWENTKVYGFFSDSSGYFNHNITKKIGDYSSILQFDTFNISPNSINIHSIGTIIKKPFANIVVKLKINNSYSMGDTLYFPNYGTNKWDTIPCPLRDTVFQPVYNFTHSGQPNLEDKNSVPVICHFSIWGGLPYQKIKEDFFKKYIPGCTGGLDTVEIEIN
tara:strand:- start:3543 stop:4199 length:657 start_codon:yes stop_codon:yes gene_type:complete